MIDQDRLKVLCDYRTLCISVTPRIPHYMEMFDTEMFKTEGEKERESVWRGFCCCLSVTLAGRNTSPTAACSPVAFTT